MTSRFYPTVLFIIFVCTIRCEGLDNAEDTVSAPREYSNKESAALSMLADTLGQLSALLKKTSTSYELPSYSVDAYQAAANQPYQPSTVAPNYPAAYYQVTPAPSVQQYPSNGAPYPDYPSNNPSAPSANLLSAYYPPELYPTEEQPTPSPYPYTEKVTTPRPYGYPRYLQRAMRPGSLYYDTQETRE